MDVEVHVDHVQHVTHVKIVIVYQKLHVKVVLYNVVQILVIQDLAVELVQ
jgi:hypothetical protein